jgi:hypothetical protein
MRKAAFALIVLLLSVGFAGAAFAQAQGLQNVWKSADQCAKDAFATYPDYTPEANDKREEFRRACLRDHKIAAPDTPLQQQSLGVGQ